MNLKTLLGPCFHNMLPGFLQPCATNYHELPCHALTLEGMGTAEAAMRKIYQTMGNSMEPRNSMEPPMLKCLKAGHCACSVTSWRGPQLMQEQGWSSCGSNIDKAQGWTLRAHCYCHGRQCSAKFIRPLGFPDGLMVHVVGFSCTDWSSMGVGEGWLGKTSLVFAQWLAEQMETPDQDFLVTECASKFDAEHFCMAGE